MNPVEILLHDLRHGVRLLHRNAGFSAVAILALALGVGVNAAVFTAYKAMLLRPLDARNPSELVNYALVRQSGSAQFTFSYPEYEAYRDSSRSFAGLGAFTMERVTMAEAGNVISQRTSAAQSSLGKLGLFSGTANAEFAITLVVSENYFKLLGVATMRGRTFDQVGTAGMVASPCVLISENYWQRRFAGNPNVLGKTIRLNGVAVAVIGITPHNFVGTAMTVPDLWLPVHLAPLIQADANWLHDRENRRLRLFGRLKPDATVEQARAEMDVISARLRAARDPRTDAARPAAALLWRGSPFPLPLDRYPGVGMAVVLIMVAAVMVLVVACANVGSLQLARSRARVDELQTRLSLGATRLRVVAQLLTENMVLSLIAGAVALLFTWALLRVAVALVADALPLEYGTLVFDVTPDVATFAYMLAISVAATLVFGLAPALESSRAALARSTRGSTSPLRSRRLQSLFLSAQVALALVLLIAGGMLIRSSINSVRMDPGYDSKHLVAVNYEFPEGLQYSTERRQELAQQVRGRLEALPQVAAVTVARAPNDSPFQTLAGALEVQSRAAANQQVMLHYSYVQPNYFETVGIPLVAGRGFERDGEPAGRSVVLSESAARSLWPGRSAIGRPLRLGPTDERSHDRNEAAESGPTYEVTGVVRDIRGVEFDGSNSSHVYLPLPDDRVHRYPILVRTKSDPVRLAGEIEPVIASADRNLLASAATLEEMLHQSGPFIVASLAAIVSSTVGLFGLVLAAMGIHGTVAYMVAQRTREVGIRMALGAQRRQVLGLVLRDSIRPVLAGVIAGVVLAVGVSYLLRRVLYGLHTVDGVSFVGVAMLFLGVSFVAALAPARRATTVDPAIALRCD